MRTLGRIIGGVSFVVMPWLYGAGCAVPVETPTAEETPVADPADGEGHVGEASDAVYSCHGEVTCPDPKSCGGWSAFYDCGTQCLYNRACGGCPPIGQDLTCVPDGTKGLYDYSEQFRTCILQNGHSCTEYHRSAGYVISCGCSP